MTAAIATLAVLATIVSACATVAEREPSRIGVGTTGPHFGPAVTGGGVRGPG